MKVCTYMYQMCQGCSKEGQEGWERELLMGVEVGQD